MKRFCPLCETKNRLLNGVGVLIFVHQNFAIAGCDLARGSGRFSGIAVGQEADGLVLEVGKVEQAALPPSGVRPGQRAVHRVFGPGTVLSFRDPIVEIRFPAKGDKKFVLSDSVQRGLLRLEE